MTWIRSFVDLNRPSASNISTFHPFNFEITLTLPSQTMSTEQVPAIGETGAGASPSVPAAATEAPAQAVKEGKEGKEKEVVLGEDGKPLSKGELKKRAKEAES
jgi:hypothetical protein